LRQDFAQQPRGLPGPVAVIGQDDRGRAIGDRLPGQPHPVRDGVDLGRGHQGLAVAPREGGDVLRRPGGEARIAIRRRLDGHAAVRCVTPWETEEDVDEQVRLAGLPHERPLNEVGPRRCAGPLRDGG